MAPRWRTALVMCLAGIGTLAARQAPTTTIRLGTVVPANSAWDNALLDVTADWNRLSAGAPAFRVVHLPDSEATIIRKVETATIDGAALSVSALSDLDPAFNLFSLPLFYESDDELRDVEDTVMPLLKTRLESHGLVLLHVMSAGWVHVFSRTAIRSVADLQAAKMATVGVNDAAVHWYQSNGFQPTRVALADVLTALQTGRVTAVAATPFSALGFGWFRAAPHMQEIRLAPLIVATVVARRAWAGIAPPLARSLLDAAARSEARLRRELAAEDPRSIDVMKTRGLAVPGSDARALAEWRTAAARWAAGARGTFVPADVYDAAVRARAAFRARAR